MDRSQTIGVFFGSRSPEHDISIITAELVIAGLKGMGCRVLPVYLGKQGEWFIGEELGKLETFTDPNKKNLAGKFSRYFLDLEKSVGKLVFRQKSLWGKTHVVNLAFPAFHGSFGEDGTIQGLFEIFGVPYVGCDVTSSAIAMDKILTKQFYQQFSIPTTPFVHYSLEDWERDREAVLRGIQQKLRFPLFVKPARLGSSIGVAKAKTEKELELSVETALHYGQRVLAEASVENLADLTVAVLGNDDPRPSLIQESVFADEFFSYEDKYLRAGGAQLGKARRSVIIPARLDKKITETLQTLAVKIFKSLGCSGIARVDFLYDRKSQNYFANEVNTLPGTLYHHLWQKSGVSLEELLEKLLMLAEERHQKNQRPAYTFASDILRRTGGGKLPCAKLHGHGDI